MVDAPSDFTRLRRGRQSDASAFLALRGAVCGDAGKPAGDGLYRQAHDDQPALVATESVVAASDGRRRRFGRRSSTQCAHGAIVKFLPLRKSKSCRRMYAGTICRLTGMV